jgi:type I restriction enzyme S subunit
VRQLYQKMKPSGVEWLGEIPEHWEIKRGRFCMAVNPGLDLLRPFSAETEVSFVPMEAVGEYGGLDLS